MHVSKPQFVRRSLVLLLFMLLGNVTAQEHSTKETSQNTTISKATVGVETEIRDLILPGSQLQPKPLDDDSQPIVVRIIRTYQHGSATRYDLSFYGLDPGEYNLCDYLVRADGSSTDDLPRVPIHIQSVLPPGQVTPNALSNLPGPRLGGYQLLLIVGGVLWLIGLLAILLVGRKKHQHVSQEIVAPLSFAQRIRPLVEAAQQGELPPEQRAELERLLLGYWQQKLNVEAASPTEAIKTLRHHETAGTLLRQLEDWLHRPDPDSQMDVTELLKPYEHAQ